MRRGSLSTVVFKVCNEKECHVLAKLHVTRFPSEEIPNCSLCPAAAKTSNKLKILFVFSSRRENGIGRAAYCVSQHSSFRDIYEVEERTSVYVEIMSVCLPVRPSVCDQASATEQSVG
jgi:hypothetical protein